MEAKVTARYLNERQVSKITGRALSTLRNERSKKTGISYSKIGRSVRYNIKDVIEFMESRKIKTQWKKTVMSQIILDFIQSAGTDDGYGYFSGKPEVVEYAKGISKNQKNKYIRYGKIPKVFFKYLDTIFESDHNAWEYLRLDLIEETCPGLNDKPVDTSEMLYKMIEENLRLHGTKHLRY